MIYDVYWLTTGLLVQPPMGVCPCTYWFTTGLSVQLQMGAQHCSLACEATRVS